MILCKGASDIDMTINVVAWDPELFDDAWGWWSCWGRKLPLPQHATSVVFNIPATCDSIERVYDNFGFIQDELCTSMTADWLKKATFVYCEQLQLPPHRG
jgi:hypothetical protein